MTFASDQFETFHDIEVVPNLAHGQMKFVAQGGPVWPDFAAQGLVRTMRSWQYRDEPVRPSGQVCEKIARPCVWGGYAVGHFGHLIADHLTRTLESRIARPDDLFLFLLPPRGKAEQVAGFFWDILLWYGIGRDQVHFVTKPVIAAELRCFSQAEPFSSYPPSERYLRQLAKNARERQLQPDPSNLTYVGRSGMLARGKGGHAGETYLVDALQRAGVRVLDPTTASLREQLAIYAGAKALVFSEGSAVHGRQLLARAYQSIAVLNRRPGSRIAASAIRPRCRDLRYVEACSRFIGMRLKGGKRDLPVGMALYDLDAVFKAFAGFGVDLRPHWVEADYATAVLSDSEAWLMSFHSRGVAEEASLEKAIAELRDAGVPVFQDE